MGDKTGIEWTDATWNPTVGCSIVSPGCHNCYAADMATRLVAMGNEDYVGTVDENGWTGKLKSLESRLDIPVRWKRPRRIFVNSMSDLFHDQVPQEFIDQVFSVMQRCQQHQFQVLTKRAKRMVSYICEVRGEMPLPNVILGVSVEDQKRAQRAEDLAVIGERGWRTMISAEPLLGPVILPDSYLRLGKTAWVIVGGESGTRARPYVVEHAAAIIRQCHQSNVPVFHKQLGTFPVTTNINLYDFEGEVEVWGEYAASARFRLSSPKGSDVSEWPVIEDDEIGLDVRQFPQDEVQ